MKTTWGVLLLAGAGLAACNQGPDPDQIASGGSAGELGPGYCETVPEDPTELQRWNELCDQGGRSR